MTSEILLKKVPKDKILILGSGYIGNALFDSLDGYDRTLVSSKTLNYHDQKTLHRHILTNDISVVINCSGFTGIPNVDQAESKKGECWYYNVISPLHVNTICQALGVKYIHISSGCIYNGYEKIFTEEDTPNFGLYDDSSFYSKSKHAFEETVKHLSNKILRIRMPISPDHNPRNYLVKMRNYDNVIAMKNSKTYIPEFCEFVKALLGNTTKGFWIGNDVYNVVNPDPVDPKEMFEIMKNHNYYNPKWNFVELKDLKITAPRSNCVISNEKADSIYKMSTESHILSQALKKMA